MENWKSIVGYEGLYEVSDLGRVRNIKGLLLRLRVVKNKEYFIVNLSRNSKKKTKYVHRLVAEAFIPNNSKKPMINHKNGVKRDNRASNLEWCTAKENSQHALLNGFHSPIVTDKCRKACIDSCCKKVICTDNGKVFKSSYEAAIWLNNQVFSNTKKTHTIAARIRNVCAGDRNKCYGLKFKHVN